MTSDDMDRSGKGRRSRSVRRSVLIAGGLRRDRGAVKKRMMPRAIEPAMTVRTMRLPPVAKSPKARSRQPMTMAKMSPVVTTGPWMSSARVLRGPSQGMPPPEVEAAAGAAQRRTKRERGSRRRGGRGALCP